MWQAASDIDLLKRSVRLLPDESQAVVFRGLKGMCVGRRVFNDFVSYLQLLTFSPEEIFLEEIGVPEITLEVLADKQDFRCGDEQQWVRMENIETAKSLRTLLSE